MRGDFIDFDTPLTASEEITLDELAASALADEAAMRYANALISIVGQPWRWSTWDEGLRECPCCGWDEVHLNTVGHADDCAWLIAGRALGVA